MIKTFLFNVFLFNFTITKKAFAKDGGDKHMRKIVLVILALMALVCSFAIADRGINQTPESQGITTAATIDMVGNFAATTDIQWRITDDYEGLNGIPPLTNLWPAYYASTYSEDTYSNGVGYISYDKNMDVETSEQLSGQWNIEAVKQIEFVGVDGARIYSDENIMVDGEARVSVAVLEMLCPFASEPGHIYIPAYCNFAEAGSTVDMTVANVRTNTMDRFVVPTSDTSVELEHDIQVTELIEGVPSSGTASTHMDVLIMEGRFLEILAERIEFSEDYSLIGDITVYDKQMNYQSQVTGPTTAEPRILP
jgi:hypothetical protein